MSQNKEKPHDVCGVFFYASFARASLFKKPSSMALSKEFSPSFSSPSFCSSSSMDIIISHDFTRLLLIYFGTKRSGLNTVFLSIAIKYVSAIASTQVSMSEVRRSNNKWSLYLSVDQ